MTQAMRSDGDPSVLRREARARIEPAVDQLMEQRRYRLGTTLLLDSICRHLSECDIPLHRASLQVRQLHPQFASRTIMWDAEAGGAVELGRRHGSHLLSGYLQSPIRLIFEGSGTLRRRIADPDCALDFPVLHDLKARGYTDYVIEPVDFVGGIANALSFATRQQDGFSELQLAMIKESLPTLGVLLELDHLRRTARGLLHTYLGPSAGERVLAGSVRRGDGEIIPAVIWFCDLRGFTALSERLPMDDLLGLMNDYFDEICGEIDRHGGEVLKFIGDAVLAIFPTGGSEAATRKACTAAIGSALGAFERLETRNRARSEADLPAIRCGVALHIGDVLYGNVGAVERLDFTVSGPAVNLAARLEGLSAGLDQPVVMSAAFARYCGRDCRSIGSHALKGVAEPQEAFILA